MEQENNILQMEMLIVVSTKMVDLMGLAGMSGRRREHSMRVILKMG